MSYTHMNKAYDTSAGVVHNPIYSCAVQNWFNDGNMVMTDFDHIDPNVCEYHDVFKGDGVMRMTNYFNTDNVIDHKGGNGSATTQSRLAAWRSPTVQGQALGLPVPTKQTDKMQTAYNGYRLRTKEAGESDDDVYYNWVNYLNTNKNNGCKGVLADQKLAGPNYGEYCCKDGKC